LLAGLGAAGLEPVVPAAGYFTVTDLSAVGLDDAAAATEALAARAGVVGIPLSALCTPGAGTGGPDGASGGPDTGAGAGSGVLRSWMRWAFCKPMDTIEEAARRLAALPAVSAD
jgi:N-succinyldiaminopimelate aminotransferase